MFTTKVSAILEAIRSRAAAYTAAADAIEEAARAAESARIEAMGRIAEAVQFLTVVPADVLDNGPGQDAVFHAALDAAVQVTAVEPSTPAVEPAVEEKAAKPARKRGKVKAGEPDETFVTAIKGKGADALVIPYGSHVRVVASDGSVYDRPGTVDAVVTTLEANGLTVYQDYPSWDARQPA